MRTWALAGGVGLMLAAAVACGNGDSGDSPTVSGQSPPATPGSGDGAEGDRAAPIAGPLVYVSGLGLFVVDPTTGEGRELAFSGVDDAAINVNPVLSEGAAYVLTFAPIEDAPDASRAYVSRVELASGDDERLGEVGVDRRTEDGEELVAYPELTVAAGDVWLIREKFGEAGSEVLLRMNGVTGELEASLARPRARGLTTDGELVYLWSEAGIEVLDPATEEFETLLPSGTQLAAALAPGADLGDALITRSGASPTDQDIAFAGRIPLDSGNLGAAQGSRGSPLRFMAYGGGSLWLTWAVTSGTYSGETALGQAILRFDPESRQVVGVIPTVEFGEHFPTADTISNGSGDVVWHTDALWVIDPQSNGAVIRIDGDTETATVVHRPCEPAVDCQDADAVRVNQTDPDHIWIRFARPLDADSGSQTREIALQALDPATGELVQEIPLSQVISN